MRVVSILLLGVVFIAGCRGPLVTPMVERLPDEDQTKVDAAWANMMTPPDRIDRTLLLDCILAAQLHQFGVDSLHMVSEKQVGENRIVMEVRFNRDRPADDEFSVRLVSKRGRVLRSESFSREDVAARIRFYYGTAGTDDAAGDPNAPQRLEMMAEHQRQLEARVQEVQEALAPLSMRVGPGVVTASPDRDLNTPAATDESDEGP